MLTLGAAAKMTGLGKTTLTRAIRAGRLSATRREDGRYEIDPAELNRVYSITTETIDTVVLPRPVVHHATPERDPETLARLAALEAEIRGLRDLLSEVRESRDGLRETVTRLLVALPAPPPKPDLEDVAPTQRPWWRRLAG